MHLTSKTIAALAVPTDKGEAWVWDDAVRQFGVRLRPDSPPAFYVGKLRLEGRPFKKRIGPVGDVSVDAARRKAREIISAVTLGTYTRPAVKSEAPAFEHCVTRYLAWLQREVEAGRFSYRSRNNRVGHLTKLWAPFDRLPVTAIDNRMVRRRAQELVETSGAHGARSAVVSLSSFFAWALDALLVDSNPCIGVRTAKTASREHVPSDRDLAAIWNACDGDGAFGQIIRLLLLTGTRRSELGDLAWGEVDLEERVIVIPGTRMKNRREHRIALCDEAVRILAGIPRHRERVFPVMHWSKAKAELDERSGVSNWRIHDLRRAVASGLGKLGTPPHVIAACLSHRTARGATAVYARYSYEKEKRQAILQWCAHLMGLVSGQPSNVVPLATA